jgi:uncharacterized protein RhaS with RHS repeats
MLPDKSVTKTAYGFGTDREGNMQFSTKTTDANKVTTEQFTDVRGRVTAVQNAGEVWTSFKYNAINEQIEAINDLGHATVSEYDWFEGDRRPKTEVRSGFVLLDKLCSIDQVE